MAPSNTASLCLVKLSTGKASRLVGAPACLRPSPQSRCRLPVKLQFCSSWTLFLHHLPIVFPSFQFVERVDVSQCARHNDVRVRSLTRHADAVVFEHAGHFALSIGTTGDGVDGVAHQL